MNGLARVLFKRSEEAIKTHHYRLLAYNCKKKEKQRQKQKMHKSYTI